MAELVEGAPRRVLAIYAHPDDADVACAGTLARWVKGGSEVHLVVCTDGAKGTSDALVGKSLARTRAGELSEAVAVLGIDEHQTLGMADGELENTAELRREFIGWIRRVRPDVVLGHDPTAIFFGQHYFNHHDHRGAGWALLDALSPAAALPQYHPTTGAAHQVEVAYLSGTLEPDVWVDISDTIEAKIEAVGCHRSQLRDGTGWAEDIVRSRAAAEGSRAGVSYAEGFRRLFLAP
ncbi:MAG: PIG-L deacetylase family protein [Acidimicrobiales bacterium]